MSQQKAKEGKLNDAQLKFCREYVFDWNATRAYQEAYPNSSYEAAMSSSSDLLRKPKIQAKIKEYKAKTEELAGLSRLKVAQEHKKIAFSSIAHFHNTWITRKEFDKITDDQKACISEIETKIEARRDKTGQMKDYEFVKIKLYSKQSSLDALSKMFGYNEQSDSDLGELTIKIVRE